MEETESVDELRQRLNQMKALVNERSPGTKKTGRLNFFIYFLSFCDVIPYIAAIVTYIFLISS